MEWGFKFSIKKLKSCFSQIGEDKQLFLYGEVLGRVESFGFLGVVFDRKLTWKTHIEHIVEKSKKVLNIMRYLVGLSRGANFDALKSICHVNSIKD